MYHIIFLDALASLDFKLSVSQSLSDWYFLQLAHLRVFQIYLWRVALLLKCWGRNKVELKMCLAGSDAGVDFTGLIGPEPSPTDYDSVLRRFNGSPLFTALWWSNHCSIVTFFQRERRLDYIILVLSFCRDPNAALMEFARSWRYSFIRDMSPLNSEPKFSY